MEETRTAGELLVGRKAVAYMEDKEQHGATTVEDAHTGKDARCAGLGRGRSLETRTCSVGAGRWSDAGMARSAWRRAGGWSTATTTWTESKLRCYGRTRASWLVPSGMATNYSAAGALGCGDAQPGRTAARARHSDDSDWGGKLDGAGGELRAIDDGDVRGEGRDAAATRESFGLEQKERVAAGTGDRRETRAYRHLGSLLYRGGVMGQPSRALGGDMEITDALSYARGRRQEVVWEISGLWVGLDVVARKEVGCPASSLFFFLLFLCCLTDSLKRERGKSFVEKMGIFGQM
jgi:hypothetical protein